MQKIASALTLMSAADTARFPAQVTTAIIFNVMVSNEAFKGVLTARRAATKPEPGT